MALDGLAVEVGSRTADVKSGIASVKRAFSGLGREAISTRGDLGAAEEGLDEARDSSLGLAASLVALSGRADEAGDEIGRAGRKAGASSGLFTAFSASTEGAAVSVGTLSTVTTLSLIPSLLTLGSVLVPVVAALGGFAAVAGSIAGIGAVGVMGAIATHTKQLKAALADITSTIRTAFGPMFDYFTGLLIVLSNAFEAIVPQLVPAQSAIRELGTTFLNLGYEIIAALPAVVDMATALASEFLPVATNLVSGAMSDAPAIIRGLVDALRDAGPEIMAVGAALVELAPSALEFGQNVLDIVAPALVDLLGLLGQSITTINGLDGSLQNLVITGLAVAPILTSIISALGGLPGLLAVGAVAGFAASYQRNFANIRDITQDFVSDAQQLLGNRLPKLLSAVTSTWQEWRPVIEPIVNFVADFIATRLIMTLDFLLSTLTAVVQVLGGDFSGAWTTMADMVGRQIDRIMEFVHNWGIIEYFTSTLPTALYGSLAELFTGMLVTGQRSLNQLYNAFARAFNGIVQLVANSINAAVTDLTNGINGLIKTLNRAIRKANEIDGIDKDTLSTIQAPTIAAASYQESLRTTDREVIRQRVVEKVAEITVEDGEIVAKMDERIDRSDARKGDRASREGV